MGENEKSGLFKNFQMTLDENTESRVYDLGPIKKLLCAATSLAEAVGAFSNLSLTEGLEQYFSDNYFDVSRTPH